MLALKLPQQVRTTQWTYRMLHEASQFVLREAQGQLESGVALGGVRPDHIGFRGDTPYWRELPRRMSQGGQVQWGGFEDYVERFIYPQILSRLKIMEIDRYYAEKERISAKELRSYLGWRQVLTYPQCVPLVIIPSVLKKKPAAIIEDAALAARLAKKQLEYFSRYFEFLAPTREIKLPARKLESRLLEEVLQLKPESILSYCSGRLDIPGAPVEQLVCDYEAESLDRTDKQENDTPAHLGVLGDLSGFNVDCVLALNPERWLFKASLHAHLMVFRNIARRAVLINLPKNIDSFVLRAYFEIDKTWEFESYRTHLLRVPESRHP